MKQRILYIFILTTLVACEVSEELKKSENSLSQLSEYGNVSAGARTMGENISYLNVYYKDVPSPQGADNIFFTGDDKVEYYTLGYSSKFEEYKSSGDDNIWFTLDDEKTDDENEIFLINFGDGRTVWTYRTKFYLSKDEYEYVDSFTVHIEKIEKGKKIREFYTNGSGVKYIDESSIETATLVNRDITYYDEAEDVQVEEQYRKIIDEGLVLVEYSIAKNISEFIEEKRTYITGDERIKIPQMDELVRYYRQEVETNYLATVVGFVNEESGIWNLVKHETWEEAGIYRRSVYSNLDYQNTGAESYTVVFFADPLINNVTTIEYTEAGVDELWYSEDDKIGSYTRTILKPELLKPNFGGIYSEKSVERIGDKGNDKVWFTNDDLIESQTTYIHQELDCSISMPVLEKLCTFSSQ